MQSTRKITKAMEMVAASKMKKAQDRMRASRPYVEQGVRHRACTSRRRTPSTSIRSSSPRETVKRVGAIVVTTDKGLCGGLNTNVLRLVLQQHKEWRAKGIEVDYVAIGGKGLGFLQRHGRQHRVERRAARRPPAPGPLVGPVKVLIDEYLAGKIDEVHVFYTTFINTMKQEPRHGRHRADPAPVQTPRPARCARPRRRHGSWDYIYEPDARELLDGMMRRYIEAIIFQMVNENMASEQSARMVAMKAASDNAGKIIDELQLIYNKTRQAAITKELSEIVGGAAAV